MRRLVLTVFAFAALAACVAPPKKPAPVTNRPTAVNSCATLIPVAGRTTAEGIRAQDRWLAQHHPGARRVDQAMTECGGVPVERVQFRTGERDFVVLFDVSAFFGKVEGTDLDDLLDG